MQKQIKAGLGVFANRLDISAQRILRPYLNATNSKEEKLFEIRRHGMDHVRTEFSGTVYLYKKSHFEQADKTIRELPGIMHFNHRTMIENGTGIPEFSQFL